MKYEIDLPREALTGIIDVYQERKRQIEDLDYTSEHDANHAPGELLAAGMCYIDLALGQIDGYEIDNPPFHWPWQSEDWKPSDDFFKNLRKGTALILAEYDRSANNV